MERSVLVLVLKLSGIIIAVILWALYQRSILKMLLCEGLDEKTILKVFGEERQKRDLKIDTKPVNAEIQSCRDAAKIMQKAACVVLLLVWFVNGASALMEHYKVYDKLIQNESLSQIIPSIASLFLVLICTAVGNALINRNANSNIVGVAKSEFGVDDDSFTYAIDYALIILGLSFFTVNPKCAIIILLAWVGKHCELMFHIGEKDDKPKNFLIRIKKYIKQMLFPNTTFLSLCQSYIYVFVSALGMYIVLTWARNATIDVLLYLYGTVVFLGVVGSFVAYDSFRIGWHNSPVKANEELVRVIIRYCEKRDGVENNDQKKVANLKVEKKTSPKNKTSNKRKKKKKR